MSTTLQLGRNLSAPVTIRQSASTKPTRWLVFLWCDKYYSEDNDSCISGSFERHLPHEAYATFDCYRMVLGWPFHLLWQWWNEHPHMESSRCWKTWRGKFERHLNFKLGVNGQWVLICFCRSNPERNQPCELAPNSLRNSLTIQRSNGSTVTDKYLNTSTTPGTKCEADALQPSESAYRLLLVFHAFHIAVSFLCIFIF